MILYLQFVDLSKIVLVVQISHVPYGTLGQGRVKRPKMR